MTGGMAFEAMNHAGDLAKNLIIVLNDNEMSISPNVGALSSFLSRKLSGKTLMYLKREMENFLKSMSGLGTNILQVLRRSVDSLISFFTPGMLFQALEIIYRPIKRRTPESTSLMLALPDAARRGAGADPRDNPEGQGL